MYKLKCVWSLVSTTRRIARCEEDGKRDKFLTQITLFESFLLHLRIFLFTFNSIQVPINGCLAKFLEGFICLRKMFAAHEMFDGQRRRVRSHDDAVLLRVNEFLFLLREASPENEDNFVTLVAQLFNDGVSEFLPSKRRVRVRFVRPAEKRSGI